MQNWYCGMKKHGKCSGKTQGPDGSLVDCECHCHKVPTMQIHELVLVTERGAKAIAELLAQKQARLAAEGQK